MFQKPKGDELVLRISSNCFDDPRCIFDVRCGSLPSCRVRFVQAFSCFTSMEFQASQSISVAFGSYGSYDSYHLYSFHFLVTSNECARPSYIFSKKLDHSLAWKESGRYTSTCFSKGYVYIYIIYMHIHAYIHTYMHAYVHTYIHTYIYIFI